MAGQPLTDGQMGVLGAGDAVELAVSEGGQVGQSAIPARAISARLLVLGGVPLREPIAAYGPFVMNTKEQIAEAIDDYRNGRMGAIRR